MSKPIAMSLLIVFAIPLEGGSILFAPKVTITAKVAPRYYLGASVKKILLIDKRGRAAELGYCRFIGYAFPSLLKKTSKFMTADLIQTPTGFLADFESSSPVAKELRSQFPADMYAGLTDCGCATAQKGSFTTKDLRFEVTCQGRLRLIDGTDGHEITSFMVRGTTTRGNDIQRQEAELEASDNAASEAVLMIAPYTHEFTIALEKNVPGENEAFDAVKQKNYQSARAIWEGALVANSGSAALNFDLGVVSEAAGDLEAARKYYREAARLAPAEGKYRDTLAEFEKRVSDAELLSKGFPRLR